MNALDSYIPGGRYDSKRDAYLHMMCQEGWANESTGDVASPVGYVYLISNKNGEMVEVIDAFGPFPIGSDRSEWPIVGHFIVTETDQGFVYVDRYDTEFLAKNAFDALETAYLEWDES